MTGIRLSVFSRVRSESARGCSPRCSRTVRKPSAIAASATSLVVTLNLPHTSSTAARGTRTVLYRLMVVTGVVDDARAAGHIAPARLLVTVPARAEARHRASGQPRFWAWEG